MAQDDKDKLQRQKNHIIHDVENSIYANEFVKELFLDHLKTDIKPTSIKRIGTPNKNKSNLIQIKYSLDTDKITISSSLRLLKNAPPKFKSIRISDDLTFADQIKLRKLRDEASERNISNTDESIKYVVHYDRISKNYFITTIKIPDKATESPLLTSNMNE